MLNVAAFLVGGDFFDVGEDDDGFDSKKIFFAEETEITMFTCFKIYKIKTKQNNEHRNFRLA
jgi:hypothetical protein